MELTVGTIYDGKVTGITKFGAFVALPGGKSGMVHISEVANTYVEDIKQYLAEGVKGGHDGMDWLVFSAFFDSVRQGETPPIDVYDMASWMAVTALSEQSVAMGGLPVAFPDFTNGRWIAREPIIERHFCLDKICE